MGGPHEVLNPRDRDMACSLDQACGSCPHSAACVSRDQRVSCARDSLFVMGKSRTKRAAREAGPIDVHAVAITRGLESMVGVMSTLDPDHALDGLDDQFGLRPVAWSICWLTSTR